MSRDPIDGPQRVADVLTNLWRRFDAPDQAAAHRIWGLWPDVVGIPIARRAQPSGFRNHVLFVAVATHGWMQELRFMTTDIRERLNTHLGGPVIREILFAVGRVAPPAPDELPTRALPPDAHPVTVLPPIADARVAEALQRVVDARTRRLAGERPASFGAHRRRRTHRRH
jgi:hypothetical protein